MLRPADGSDAATVVRRRRAGRVAVAALLQPLAHALQPYYVAARLYWISVPGQVAAVAADVTGAHGGAAPLASEPARRRRILRACADECKQSAQRAVSSGDVSGGRARTSAGTASRAHQYDVKSIRRMGNRGHVPDAITGIPRPLVNSFPADSPHAIPAL